METQHTQTLFFLAQTLGKLGDDAASADYCGTCLRRQLEAGTASKETWRQNTAQLAMFYTNKEDYATATYCLAAAAARAFLRARALNRHLLPPCSDLPRLLRAPVCRPSPLRSAAA